MMTVLNFKKSKEYKNFEDWCTRNNRYPMKLLKKYCQYTVLQDRDLVLDKTLFSSLPLNVSIREFSSSQTESGKSEIVFTCYYYNDPVKVYLE